MLGTPAARSSAATAAASDAKLLRVEKEVSSLKSQLHSLALQKQAAAAACCALPL
jgi:hypothetical protein